MDYRRIAMSVAAVLGGAALCSCSVEARKARHLEQADTYFSGGEYEKAKVEYLSVLRLSFKDPRAISQLGRIWLAEGEPLRAYAYLLEASDLTPNDLEVRTKLAAVLSSLGELKGARDQVRTVLETDPGNEEALLVLTDTVRSDVDMDQAQQQLRKIPEGNEVAYHLAWAALAGRVGNLPYVKSELEEAIKANPRSARAHAMTAAFYASQKSPIEAEREFRTALGYSPLGSSVSVQYAQFEHEQGKDAEARAILNETLKAAPYYQAARVFLAQIAFGEGKFDEALGLLERVLDIDFANIDALILQAQVWLAKGETKRAAESMERLDVSYPDVPFIKYQLARAYVRDNQLSQALLALDQAIGQKPDYIDAILLRGEVELRAADPAKVVASMMVLSKQQPGLRQAKTLLAEAYRASGQLDNAAAVIREQIQDSPQSPDGYLRLGMILRQQQKSSEAEQVYEKAAELAPDDLTAFDRIIELNIEADNFGGAMQRVREQLAKTPQSPIAEFAEAKVYVAQNDWIHGEEALVKTIQLDPKLTAAYELLAFDYASSGRIEQAIEQVQAVLSKNQRDERALMMLGLIREKQQDYAGARDAYENLLAINPNFTAALNNLAYLYIEHLDNLPRACELARKAQALQPRDPSIADTLGWALLENGDFGDALQFLKASAKQLPDNPNVQFHLGMASYMMGDTDLARTALKRAVSENPNFPNRADAQRRLEFLNRQNWSVDELQRVIKADPQNVVALSRLGQLFESQGNTSAAATAYEQLLNVNAESVSAAVKLAQLYAGPLDDYNMAFAYAKRARDLAPNDGQVAAVLARVVYQLRNFSWAYSLFQESSRKLANDPALFCSYARCAYMLGRVREARSLMERALNSDPDSRSKDDAASFLRLTSLNGQSEEATIKDLEPEVSRILEKKPNDVPASVTRARIYTARNDFQSAIRSYLDLLGKYPDFPFAEKYLAMLYAQDDTKLGEALTLAAKARSVLTDDPELARTLGQIAYKRQDYNYAIECFQDRARQKPLDATDFYYLGMSELRMSRDADSKKSLEQALAVGLQEPMLNEARNVLRDLQNRSGLGR